MDVVTGTIIGASVAGGSAVLAQVVAAMFTSRRELRRFNWERERALAADSRDREQLHLASRRESFTKILQLVTDRLDLLHKAWLDEHVAKDGSRALADKIDDTSADYWRSYGHTLMEIQLICPSVVPLLREIRGQLAEWEDEIAGDDYYGRGAEHSDKLHDLIDRVSVVMRKELGLPKEGLSAVSAQEENEAD